MENPALINFIIAIGDELSLAQVNIRRTADGYELQHVDDCGLTAPGILRLLNLSEVRSLAQFTAAGAFRPLKSAPTLQRGWRLIAATDAELEAALTRLYPGAVADWHAARSPHPSITNYRDYANRQSGMFRVTAKLSDAQVADVIATCCHPKSCLKRRLWTVKGVMPDPMLEKSLIPCLEPCALLMEAARVAFRASATEAMKLAEEEKTGKNL